MKHPPAFAGQRHKLENLCPSGREWLCHAILPLRGELPEPVHLWEYVLDNMPNQFAPTTQLMSDIQNGTLPQVSFIEPAGYVGLDEHPTDTDVTNAPMCSGGRLRREHRGRTDGQPVMEGLRSLSSPMTRRRVL